MHRWYVFNNVEITQKETWIEADSFEEAYMLAQQEGIDKNVDSCTRHTELIKIEDM